MTTENEDGSDQRSKPATATTALLVDPAKRSIRLVIIGGYEGIRARFTDDANLEGNTVCHVADNIYLHSWADCNGFMTAPAWRTSFAPGMPMHGLTLIDAYDMSTGESIFCPYSPEQFAMTIQWEDYANRLEPQRPNKEWADKGGYEWSVGDLKGNVQVGGSTWEDAGRVGE